MNMNIEVEVRQDHIDRGMKRNTECCPIALAILDHFEGIRSASVGRDIRILPGKGGERTVVCKHTRHSFAFMLAFDDGRDVEPFKLKLEPKY